MTLTDHISLEELTRSDTAVRLGFDNKPPADLVPNLADTARMLERTCATSPAMTCPSTSAAATAACSSTAS